MEDFIAMGFDEATVNSAFEAARGNKDLAMEILLGEAPPESAGPVMASGCDDETVTALEISQYSFSEVGSSACTPIACSAVAALLDRLENNVDINDAAFLNEAVVSGVRNYSAMQASESVEHISVEDFTSMSPDLKLKITQVGESFQGLLTDSDPFHKMIIRAQEISVASSSNLGYHIGIVITKPPETVCITVPSLDCAEENRIYSFFDSHCRPEFGLTGSYLATSQSMDSIILRLGSIFPENSGIVGGDYQDSYMEMLYTTYEATVFEKTQIAVSPAIVSDDADAPVDLIVFDAAEAPVIADDLINLELNYLKCDYYHSTDLVYGESHKVSTILSMSFFSEPVSRSDRMAVNNGDVLQLYSALTPNGIKVAACLEELCDLRAYKEHFNYEAHSLNLRNKESRIGEYYKLVPHGKIPAIVDPNGPTGNPITVWESGAILGYLAEKYNELICSDPKLRVECNKWLFWGSVSISSQIKSFGFYYKYCPHKEPYCIQRTAKEVTRLLGALENQLETHGKHWIVGDVYTIADISVWPWIHALHQDYDDAITAVFDDLKAFPNIREWYARCIARPASRRSLQVTPYMG